MKRYVRFGEGDVLALARFRPVAAPHFPRIAEEFYDRIREHEGAHAVFTGEEQIARLQASLVRWLDRLCQGPHDEAYFQGTVTIGKVHVRIGLPQRYMFTAMALIRLSLLKIAEDEMPAEEVPAVRDAINRALDLELAIMLESYRDHFVDRIQQVERLEKQEAYRTLRRAEGRYVTAVKLARVMIVGLDAEGTIRLFNPEAERVTGFARDEVFGKGFVETLCPSDAAEPEHAALFRTAAAGTPLAHDALQCVIRTRPGKLREIHWQLAYAPPEGDDHDVVLLCFGRDATDESALGARLRQAEKLAAVGTLAAGLAHEIRNPLNGAQLHLTFLERALRKTGGDRDALEAVHVVADEIKRLSVLVTEFLDFARPRPLNKKRGNLRALCERAIQLIEPAARAAHVEIRPQFPTNDIVLELDGAKMEQVLLNLLQNAVEALEPAGGGSVVVRMRRRPLDAVIEIEDDGPGLSSAEAPIFDPFFSTKPSGTGLGLAIVHRIVTDHEGAIDVESAPGKTIFRVTLPIRLTEEAELA